MTNTKNTPIIGAHLSIKEGFAQAVLDTVKIGANALQIFTKSNRMWKSKPITQAQIAAWHEACVTTGLNKKNILVHASYLINLASNIRIAEQSQYALIDELIRAHQLEINTVVLHPGSRGTQSIEEGLNKIINGLEIVLAQTDTTVIALETMAGQGSSVGSTIEELAFIINNIKTKYQYRLGICLDTCHLFAAGYSLSTKADYKSFWNQFTNLIGKNYLKATHMNDSKKGFQSHLDRHEAIGKGCIPQEFFTNIMNDENLKEIPKIIETPKNSLLDDAENIKRLLSLINKIAA